MRILKTGLINKYEEKELSNALSYINSYANLSSRLYNYPEANPLYWLKGVALEIFSKPEGILLKASIDTGYRLYATHELGGRSFLKPINGAEAEGLSKSLPLKVDTYLGSYKDDEPEEFTNLYEAIKVIYDFIHEVDERFAWELGTKEEEYQFFLLKESKDLSLETLERKEQEQEEGFLYDLTEEDFDFDEE